MKQNLGIVKPVIEWLGYIVYALFLMTVGAFFYLTSGHATAVAMVIVTACVSIGISIYFDLRDTNTEDTA